MSKFFKDKTDDLGFVCIKEECAKVRFSCRCYHQFENCAGDMNSAIDFNWGSITRGTAKEEVATGMTLPMRCTEIQGIGGHIDYHVVSGILYFGIGMSGHVVQELDYANAHVFSRQSLLTSDSR